MTAAAPAGVPITSPVHTLSLFVADRPGVLVRVALVFARRGYNIESLVVSQSARGGFSRMTITCSGDPTVLEQIIKQLAKLVDVVHAIDHTGDAAYESEIALIKVECGLAERTEILQISEHFNARAVDYGPESVILRVLGTDGRGTDHGVTSSTIRISSSVKQRLSVGGLPVYLHSW